MKIIIIGVSGFIGKNLFQSLNSKYDVYGLSRSKVDLKNCIQLDLYKEKDVCEYFLKNNFDIVIQLASLMASHDNLRHSDLLLNNLKIQFNLIKALKNHKSSFFINFSSSAVYPNISGDFSENDIIDSSSNNDCLYGLSKFNSEILFKFFLKNNFDILNLRLGYVYGDNMDKTRIHKVFENELKNKNTITLWGNGVRILPQISIDFLIKNILTFIEKPISGTFNLAEENISLERIAKNIIKKNGNISSKILYLRNGNTEKFKMNLSKIRSVLKK